MCGTAVHFAYISAVMDILIMAYKESEGLKECIKLLNPQKNYNKITFSWSVTVPNCEIFTPVTS